jgi:hypothetical protein
VKRQYPTRAQLRDRHEPFRHTCKGLQRHSCWGFFETFLLTNSGAEVPVKTPFSRAMVQMPARPWHGAAGRIEHAFLYTKPSTTAPHARGRGGTRWGSSASQPLWQAMNPRP